MYRLALLVHPDHTQLISAALLYTCIYIKLYMTYSFAALFSVPRFDTHSFAALLGVLRCDIHLFAALLGMPRFDTHSFLLYWECHAGIHIHLLGVPRSNALSSAALFYLGFRAHLLINILFCWVFLVLIHIPHLLLCVGA